MRKLCLRQVSFEKQMTVFLPFLSVVLLLCSVLGVARVRQTDAPSGEGERTAPVSGEPVTVAVLFCADEAVLVTALRIEPQNGRILLAAAPSAFVGDHAVTLDAAGVRSLLEYYGDGVPVTLKEAVSYTDESGLRGVSCGAGAPFCQSGGGDFDRCRCARTDGHRAVAVGGGAQVLFFAAPSVCR